ncbi:hypothetical protein [Herbaspirillum huttiense]|uniref:hypothetical protein n=1 Tax=Herbaspirillum huttiense TaxID=863372 RepID=UPI0012FE82EA|nr:hypothetical protein [Herbaspirillum huttiense]
MKISLKRTLLAAFLVNAPFVSMAHASASCDACTGDAGEPQLCAPAAVDGLQRVSFPDAVIAQNRAYRNTLLAGYNKDENRLAVTFFLYDRVAGSDEEDVKEAIDAAREILSVHPGSKLQMGGPASLPLGGENKRGNGAMMIWHEGSDDYASFLWVLPIEKRFMKVRATYVRPHGGESEAMRSALDTVKSLSDQVCR